VSVTARERDARSGVEAVLLVPALLLNGWIFCRLWRWFVMPVLPVPPLTMASAIGLGILWEFLRGPLWPQPNDADALDVFLVRGFFHPVLALGVGWCVSWWMP
jgi:hypothetical protein